MQITLLVFVQGHCHSSSMEANGITFLMLKPSKNDMQKSKGKKSYLHG